MPFGTADGTADQRPGELANNQPDTEDKILDDTEKDEFGDNEEIVPGLTKELEGKVIGLVQQFEQESYATWRFLNRDFLEAEMFWKDVQYGWYDYEQDIFRLPTAKDIANIGDSDSRFQYVTNIYRALGWTLVSVLGQKIPKTVFLPADYTNEADVVTARAAGDTVPFLERSNKVNLRHMRAAYLLYTNGICATYTRFLVNGQRFGYKNYDTIQMAEVKTQEEGYACPDCGALTAMDDANNGAWNGNCAQCGRGLGPETYQEPQTTQIPQLGVTKKTPKGQVVITIHGGLELRLPPWPQDREDCPFLGLVHEVHASQLRSTYGKRAKNVGGGWGTGGPYDVSDRFARLALVEPTVSYYSTANYNLITFKQYWLRPDTFHMLDDKDRDALLNLFPDGMYVAYADQKKLLDARNESMDDHWRLCRAQEGAAMFTPSLGSSAISIQKRFNTIMNFIMEWVEYSAAGQGTFVNTGLINVQALRQQRRQPGNIYPIRLAANQPIANAIYDSRPGQIPTEVFKHGDDLQAMGQFVTGAVPTVSGGTEQSLKPTTYLADREQALGKLFVPWQHLRELWSDTMFLAVKQFAKFAADDLKYSLPQPNNTAVNRLVRLKDLQGDFDAYPEVAEQFPRLWHEQQAMVLQLIQLAAADPAIGAILSNVRNAPFMKNMFGLPDMYVPGEDDDGKQELEIARLLLEKPSVQMGPMGQSVVMPSIMPDEFEDDHVVHKNKVVQWAVSPDGLRNKYENPDGYKNVIAHGKMHEQIIVQRAAQAMSPPVGGQAPPAAGGQTEQ